MLENIVTRFTLLLLEKSGAAGILRVLDPQLEGSGTEPECWEGKF